MTQAIHTTHEAARPPLLLLATGAGLAVASIYYAQPLLPPMAASLAIGADAAGLVPVLTQLGYAAGILLLAPLGDRYDRRRVILAKTLLLSLALLASAFAPGLASLLAASLAMGLVATVAQDFVPAAVALARPQARGRAVGTVMTGLLLGILLSRLVSGFVAEAVGWRVVFELAAAAVLLLAGAGWLLLPPIAPTTQLPYGALLVSLRGLWLRHPELRRAAHAQAWLSVGFSAFWSTLAVMLHARFGLDSSAAGLFGLAGAAGALAAPLAGRAADRRGPAAIAMSGAAIAALSFAALAGMDLLPLRAQLGLLVAATLAFDFGVQASLVAHQSMVYGLDETARSRSNALLFTAMFLGMAAGGLLGSVALAHGGWLAVAGVGTGASLAAMAVRRWG